MSVLHIPHLHGGTTTVACHLFDGVVTMAYHLHDGAALQHIICMMMWLL